METQENMQKNLKGHQKEVDKLMQEIQELRNKEKKHLVDIEYLKNQLEARTKQVIYIYFTLDRFNHFHNFLRMLAM